jgi:dihydroorotase
VHEGKCACGAFTSPFLHPLYAHALSRLLKTERGRDVYVNFTSRNARKLHNLPPASKQFNLAEKEFKIPSYYVVGPWNVEPFWAGQTLDWSIEEVKQRSLDLQ